MVKKNFLLSFSRGHEHSFIWITWIVCSILFLLEFAIRKKHFVKLLEFLVHLLFKERTVICFTAFFFTTLLVNNCFNALLFACTTNNRSVLYCYLLFIFFTCNSCHIFLIMNLGVFVKVEFYCYISIQC